MSERTHEQIEAKTMQALDTYLLQDSAMKAEFERLLKQTFEHGRQSVLQTTVSTLLQDILTLAKANHLTVVVLLL